MKFIVLKIKKIGPITSLSPTPGEFLNKILGNSAKVCGANCG